MFKTFRNLTAAELEALTSLRSTVFSKDVQVDKKFDENESGRVVTVGDGIAKIYGLKNVTASEMLEFESGVRGIALNLEYDSVRAILLGDERLVKVGDKVWRTRKIVSVKVGDKLVGRVLNALVEPCDEKGVLEFVDERLINIAAPDVISRERVAQPLETGLKVVDALIPIGRGQRELIIGDRQTGKTAIALDAIINQQNVRDPVTCIYVAIGKRNSEIRRIEKVLEAKNCMSYTIIIKATAGEPAPLLYLAPYSGTTVGEYFRDRGQHSLIIYDDLSKHAVAYRQMSLLLRRPPAREAYPADVFYLHSRLLERSAKLSTTLGGGSLTSLPVIETVQGDISAYIPTNVISITDGQIYLERSLFKEGIRPAVSPGLSVSRVGSAAQNKVMKRVAGSLKLELAQFREVEQFARFASDIDEATKRQIYKGTVLTELLTQPKYSPITVDKQAVLLFAGLNGYLDIVEKSLVSRYETELLGCMDRLSSFFPFRKNIEVSQTFDEAQIRTLLEGFNELFTQFVLNAKQSTSIADTLFSSKN